MTELYKRDLQFWDLTLSRLSFDMRVYIRVLKHQRTLVFVNLCLLTFFAADPSSTRDIVPFWFSIMLWPTAFGVYLIFYHLVLLGFSALSSKAPKLRAPLPLLGGICLLPTIYLCEAAVKWASGGLYDKDILPQLIFFFLAVQALETVFFKFIMPTVREQLSTEEEPERHLIVGGERFNLRGLLHIEAREHHVHLTFENGRKLFRARLGDIVAQTRAEDGFQPHRSWWVARDSGITPRREGGRLFLRLRDDTEVPVARTRLEEVQQWLETHLGGLR